MDREQITAFLQRPRELVDDLKTDWWASHDAVEAGHALWDHARRVQPDFPSAECLAEDLEHHLLLKSLIDRASKALADR